jgi:hypothetical protein
MSTKATLNINMPDFPADLQHRVVPERRDPTCPAFHFYEEAGEKDGSVYLEMTGAEFEATNHGIMVKIPAKVWNRIIKIGERPE